MEQYSVLVASHLAWVKARPNFTSRQWIRMTTGLMEPNQSCSYFEMLESVYSNYIINPHAVDELAQVWYRQDVKQVEEMETVKKSISLDCLRVPPEAFITIGFNHQVWSIPKCMDIIQRILDNNFVVSGSAVFELHRENGEHPHVHFVLEHVSMSKSKFLEKLWAVKGIKTMVLQKSFIDYKIATEVHKKYILGYKQESKQKYINKDVEWRKKNNIPELFRRNDKL